MAEKDKTGNKTLMEKASDAANTAKETLQDIGHQASEKAGELKDKVMGNEKKPETTGEKIKEKAAEGADAVGNIASEASDKLRDYKNQ